jgi:ABC-2 type transport system ATP-binding protein
VLPARISLSTREDPRRLAFVDAAEPGPPDGEGWSQWEVTLKPGVPAASLLDACFEQGLRLRRFDEHKPSLHEVFLHLAGDEPARSAA